MPASRIQIPLGVVAILALLLLGFTADGTVRTAGFVLVAAAYLAGNVYFERRAKRQRETAGERSRR